MRLEDWMSMRFRWLLFFIWPLFCSGIETDSWQAGSEEEALFLRRISEFWQEGEYQIAKNQIEEFIAQYPESPFSDALCSALGDLFLREKNYSQALSYYSRVQSPAYSGRVFLSRMQCLYQMQWVATLADECESHLQKNENLDPEQKLHSTYFLAIALYQQCLNAAKDPEALVKLAQRAQPYFETLFQSELSGEVAQSFAHLCCILKDFSKASQIYTDLAKKDPSREEEMLFQAALIQSEYDKELALRSFDEIARMGQKRGKEAAYNRLVLAFDTGRHAELAHAKEALFAEMPDEKIDMAHLFLGRSLLALKKYPEAVAELQAYAASADEKSESFHAALLNLLEASYQAGDLAALDLAIDKLTKFFPENPENPIELPKALFSRAQILKKNQKTEEARTELERLLAKFPRFNQRAQAVFELAHLNYQQKGWASSRNWAHLFVSEFPHHELAPFAWRYLISSSSEIAAGKPEAAFKEQLVHDLAAVLNQKEFFSASERTEWQFLCVKTLIQLGSYQDAMALLQSLLEPKGPQEANAWLLLALCYRDGLGDLEHFCEAAEKALSKNADLIDPNQTRVTLFNAYLERSRSNPELLEKSAEHLYAAFEAKAAIQDQNLLWLADFYFNRLSNADSDFPLTDKAGKMAAILEHLLHPSDFVLSEKNISLEPALCKLAQAYSILGRTEEEIALLEKLMAQYPNSPHRYSCEKEAQLLLGEAYVQKGEKEKALNLFDSILASSSTLRTPISAAASLQSARLKISSLGQMPSNSPDFTKAASQLKNLILQKTLANEPSHLEAALEYIDLQTRFEIALEKDSLEKRLSLLIKTKADFEQTEDLLSKDYHEARTKLPRKNRIYQGYMLLIDAEIFFTQAQIAGESHLQKELQAKAKDLLLQIIDGKVHPSLIERARKQFNSVQINESKPEAKA